MKKILGMISIIIIFMFALIGCQKNETNNNIVQNNNVQQNINQKEENVVLEPFNEDYNITQAFTNIKEDTGLSEVDKMSETEINKNFDFGKYKGLQKEIRTKETSDSFTEVAIIKVGENEQSTEIFLKMSKRLSELQKKYADNDEISKILANTEDNFVLRQEGGIIISVIGENAKEIASKLKQ